MPPHTADATGESIYTSTIQGRNPCAEEQNIDSLFLRFDLVAHLVYNSHQAHIRLYEYVLALDIERFALGRNTFSSVIRTAHEVNTGSAGVFRELLERYFTDSTGGSNEDCYEVRWESGRNEGIGRLDMGEGDHCSGFGCLSGPETIVLLAKGVQLYEV